jgi:anti-anti-sigma factor
MPQQSLPTWPAGAHRTGGSAGGHPPRCPAGGGDPRGGGHPVRRALREELLRVVRQYGPQLALDLTGVTFLDCAGVNVLLATRRRARLDGGWVRVIRASPRARRTISLLGLRETFALCAPASA